MIPAVIYARYSSSNQREESIDGQVRECRAFAERNGYRIIREYTDSALSGKTDRRPGFQQMIADSSARSFQIVIVWKLDRFARDRYDAAVYRKKLRDNGVKLLSAMEGITDSPEGIILEGLLESMAEYYSANLAENIKRGQYDSALKRKVIASCPLGYRKAKDGTYEIDPATAPIVQRIFREFTSGVNRQQIIDGLNADGLRTSRGKPYSANTIYWILKNEKYTGLYKFRDIVDPEGVPAIIDKGTFEKAQRMLKARQFTKERNYMTQNSYILVPKIYCGECGRMMTGESAKNHSGQIFRYYSCTGRKGPHRNGCTKSRIRSDKLDAELLRVINEQVLSDDMIDLFVREYSEHREQFAEENSLLTSYQTELATVTRKLSNISKAIAEGIWSETVKQSLLDLEARRDELVALIAEEEHTDPPITPEVLREYFENMRTRAQADAEAQKTLLDVFLRRVWVFDPQKKNGPYRAVLDLSLTGSAGEPISYELIVGDGSSQLKEVEASGQYSNHVIIGDSILMEVCIFAS